jgi:hypothetical protein
MSLIIILEASSEFGKGGKELGALNGTCHGASNLATDHDTRTHTGRTVGVGAGNE